MISGHQPAAGAAAGQRCQKHYHYLMDSSNFLHLLRCEINLSEGSVASGEETSALASISHRRLSILLLRLRKVRSGSRLRTDW